LTDQCLAGEGVGGGLNMDSLDINNDKEQNLFENKEST